MKNFGAKNFGPIKEANITFGDLTVFVGPQASGKSLFAQLFKAAKDASVISADLKTYGFDWAQKPSAIADYCSLYFGGGLQGLIGDNTVLQRDGKTIGFETIARPAKKKSPPTETVFLIPAQRVLVLQDGWPKPFMAYAAGDPYCLRRFSDSLRLLMEQGLGSGEAIFPQTRRLKAELKELVNTAIYVGAKLKLETEGMRKRIVLSPREGASALPYSAWSAGQREFTPLLLGLYWLMPPGKMQRRGELEFVIIEEPEMGLHPQAIVSFGLLVLELLRRGYRVVVSTHSPVVLDLVWAVRQLQMVDPTATAAAPALHALKDIFGLKRLSTQASEIFQAALKKKYRTYFFRRADGEVIARDISSLDPGHDDENISGWGGLSGFSGHIAEVVGRTLSMDSAQ